MPRGKQFLVLLGAVVLVALVAYVAYRTPPPAEEPPLQPREITGLEWLPAEVGLVAGVDLAALRKQAWLVALLEQVSEEEVAPDYRVFVEATGFDYSRDLDRVWLGVSGSSEQPALAGVAEGRFDQQKIVAHALKQGARRGTHHGFPVYQVTTEFRPPPTPGEPEPELRRGSFAFAFLEATRLAFGTRAEDVARVINCWRERAPAVASDPARRTELEQLAAGRQAWLFDDLEKWQPAAFRQQAFFEVLQRVALALQADAEGMRGEAMAYCHQAEQAEQLHDNLRALVLVGRVALARQPGELPQVLSELLGNVEFSREGPLLRVRVSATPGSLARLLEAAPPAPAAQ